MPLILLNQGKCFFRAMGDLPQNVVGTLGKRLTEDYTEEIVFIPEEKK
jgi:hypothetical protein